MAPIADPTRPWAIVFQRLNGTAPPSSLENDLRGLFSFGGFGGTSIADYWRDQTLGTIDVSKSVVFPWRDSGATIQTHPGRDAGVSRDALAQQARALVPNMGDFRGVIAIYNYPCSGGNAGLDVVWGINGYGSTPAWASDGWRRCDRCHRIVDANLGNSPCQAGGAHALAARRYLTVTADDVPKVRAVDRCGNCGVLFASGLPRQAGVMECPAGADHAATGAPVTVLAGWADPPAEREYSICTLCRCIAPDGDPNPCPGRAEGHVPEAAAAVHFPFVDVDERGLGARGFLCHEMGHAYGFQHGRGIEPRSHDVGDDCWPGAYGDPFDIMSYGACESYMPRTGDPDEALGRAGPGLAVQHLIEAEIVQDDRIESIDLDIIAGAGEQDVTLHPTVDGNGAGKLAARAGDYVFEYRRRSGWDRAIDSAPTPAGQEPGSVIVRHVPADGRELPELVPSIAATRFLGSGATFESRTGLGNFTASVDIAADGATADLRFLALPGLGVGRHFERWLAIPYKGSDSAATFDHGALGDLVTAVDRFWQDMAQGAFQVAGSYLLSSDEDPNGNGGVMVGATIAQLAAMSPQDRARAVVDAALRIPNPTDPARTLPIDMRWFTGLILLSADGAGGGFAGSVRLDSGVLPADKGCASADHPRRLDPLDYGVVDLPIAGLSHAALAREIGRSLGAPGSDNPFDLMADDGVAHRYTRPPGPPPPGGAFGSTAWGPMGPALDSASLLALGWLRDWEVKHVAGGGGGMRPRAEVGSVVLHPLVQEGVTRGGIVRLEAGPYALEMRAAASWDRGIGQTMVLAYGADGQPQPLGAGDSVEWGGPIPELSGGGRIEVTSLTDTEALVSYFVLSRPIIEAGGGTLHGGGTLLFQPNGKVTHIPPGDPLERQAHKLVADDMAALTEKIRNLGQH